MKTFAALIRRYVLATAAIVLLVGGLLVGQIFYVGFKSNAVDATGYRVGALADALKQTETGLESGTYPGGMDAGLCLGHGAGR